MNLSLVHFLYKPELTCLISYWDFSITKVCAKIPGQLKCTPKYI